MINVTFVIRDVNGKRRIVKMYWDEVIDVVKKEEKFTDEDQILAIVAGDVCVYSALANPPITWDDVTGFFA